MPHALCTSRVTTPCDRALHAQRLTENSSLSGLDLDLDLGTLAAFSFFSPLATFSPFSTFGGFSSLAGLGAPGCFCWGAQSQQTWSDNRARQEIVNHLPRCFNVEYTGAG